MSATSRQRAFNPPGPGFRRLPGRRRRARPDGDTFDGAAFADVVDDLPDDFDLNTEVRRMELACGSRALARKWL